MKRRIETYGKNGVIEIVGNPQETILYLNDKPIQYSWFAEIGSTWRYHIAQGLKNQIVRLNSGIEMYLKKGINNEGDFLAITEYFNQFLKYGTYEYGYFELSKDLNWIEIPKNEEYQSFDYYGGSFNITPTQNLIDHTLVEAYKLQVLKGSRPIVVLLHVENSCMFYILDGHHKFCAYRKANIDIHAMIITKIGNDYKSTKTTISLAKEMKCTNVDYLNWMKKEKNNLGKYQNYTLDLDKVFRRITINEENM